MPDSRAIYQDIFESIGRELFIPFAVASKFDLIRERGHRRERDLIKHLLWLLSKPDSLLETICLCHSRWAAGPITRPHFLFICLSQRRSLIHLSLKPPQTPAMLQSPSGGSLSRIDSNTNSGKSRRKISSVVASSTLSTLELGLLFFIDILGGT